MEAGGERAEAELVAAEVLAALNEGVEPREIVVVCRSLARSAELFERALARYGVPATSARLVPLEHTALGRALLALVRYALLPGPQRDVEDLIAYLRHPGVVERRRLSTGSRRGPQTRGRAGAALRDGGTSAAARRCATRRAAAARAPTRLAALGECTRQLLAAPHRGTATAASAPRGSRMHGPPPLVFAGARRSWSSSSASALAGAELIELLEGLQVPAHGCAAGGGGADRRAARDPRPALPACVRDRPVRGRVPEPAGDQRRSVPRR